MSEILAAKTTPQYGVNNPFGQIAPGSRRITLHRKLRRAWWHPSSGNIFRNSMESESPIASSDEFSDEETDTHSDIISDEPHCTLGSMGETIAVAPNMSTNNDVLQVVGGLSAGEDNQQELATPEFETLTARNAHVEFARPRFCWQPLIQETGPLPPDSDSEYDSDFEAEETASATRDVTPELLAHAKHCTRTLWASVEAHHDEIFVHHGSLSSINQQNCNIEHICPFAVYLLPLLATTDTSFEKPRRRKALVEGLLLVEDRDATKKHQFEGEEKECEN
jgi:hypothetical protein